MKTTAKHLEVQYDNGERDKCDPENIFPYDVPIEFGQEIYDLQVLSVLAVEEASLPKVSSHGAHSVTTTAHADQLVFKLMVGAVDMLTGWRVC